MQEACHGFFFHHLRTRSFRLQFHGQVRFRHRKLILYLSQEYIQCHPYIFFISHRHGTNGMGFSRNGIMQVTSVNVTQTQIILLHQDYQETVEQLVGIGTILIDVITRMSASQSFNCHTEEEITFRSCCHRARKFSCGTGTSGTADKQFTFIFRIQVYQNIPAHETFFQGKRSGQSRFLIHCKQAFQRSVLNIICSQHSQFSRHTDTIISTQCGTFRLQPFPINVSFNRVCLKIMYCLVVFLTYHVHVRLQHHFFQIFHTSGSRFANQDISSLIHFIFQRMGFCKVHQIISDFFFLLGRTRHTTDFFKIMKNRCRLQIFLFHKSISIND